MKIENEFVDYNTALALKKLGFDEPCILLYRGLDTQPVCQMSYDFKTEKNSDYNDATNYWLTVPTFSQCFSWFREKYNIDSEFYMNHEYGIKFYTYLLLELKGSVITHLSGFSGRFETHEETQLECLKKLIEIVNESKKD